MPHVSIRERQEMTAEELAGLLRWLEIAYDDPPGSWPFAHRDDIGLGPHLTIEEGGELLAHACLSWVPIEIGGTRLRSGYVEDVATRADVRRRGYATTLMRAVHRLLAERADIGLLATGSHGLYERLGWVRWAGPSSVWEPDGTLTRTSEEDGGIMALFVPRTPSTVTNDLPIHRRRRDREEPW